MWLVFDSDELHDVGVLEPLENIQLPSLQLLKALPPTQAWNLYRHPLTCVLVTSLEDVASSSVANDILRQPYVIATMVHVAVLVVAVMVIVVEVEVEVVEIDVVVV